jgi:serine beta-lactamase-like protein LACTB
MSIAVAINGTVVGAEGFGLADLEQCVAVSPQTKFRIGSTSKPLTSAGAALLYHQKYLRSGRSDTTLCAPGVSPRGR